MIDFKRDCYVVICFNKRVIVDRVVYDCFEDAYSYAETSAMIYGYTAKVYHVMSFKTVLECTLYPSESL